MIFKDCRDMVNAYVEWLRQKITVESIDEICEITTPFLDRHNDHLQIYVRKSNSSLILTDDGYTIRDLKLSGYESTTEKRKQILFSILNGFGARLEGDEILVEAKPEEFPQKKHNLIQAMLAINDLFVLAPPTVAGIFKEDVEAYLRLHSIRYTPSVKFTGKSGLDHSFDFVVPASQTKPERILRAINRPSRQNITMLIFSWADTREARPVESSAYGVLNDIEQTVNPDLLGALHSYGIKPLLWTKREDYVEELID